MNFDAWIRALTEDVIEDEYGYEPGEFNVFPDHWRGLFDEGLTPSQAFQRALDAHAEERRQRDLLNAENWAHIQAVDAALAQEKEGK